MTILHHLHSFTNGIKRKFHNEHAKADTRDLPGRLCERESSDGRSEVYQYIDEAPAMREVIDQFEVLGYGDLSYEITNRKFGVVLRVTRDDLADDRTKGLHKTIRHMAIAAKRHPNELVMDAVKGGDVNLCYDGAAFFSNAHPIRGEMTAVGDNLLAGTGTTTAALQLDIQSAIQAMAKFQAANGKAYHTTLSRFLIAAPLELKQSILEATKSIEINNTTNVVFSEDNFSYLFDPALSLDDANDWYLFHIGGANMPFVYQSREETSFESNFDGDSAFRLEVLEWKARARRAVGYANWRNATKTVN